ncbi:MAG: LOG family protein [Planctomycetota bacterium]
MSLHEIVPEDAAVPPRRHPNDPPVQEAIDELIESVAGQDARAFDVRMVRELLTAALKLIPDGRDTGELKLMSAAVKELRYAFQVFGHYPSPRKITIFGSARTPEHHPDYAAAVDFSKRMAEAGWMSITGAGDGIMKAGHVGPGRDASFGVAIRLPFETTANDVIEGDHKLIHFRYFFTRKLMFLFHAHAVALFPGGFGTMDEAYETLCLIQTGKATMVPVVLVEGDDTKDHPTPYWEAFDHFAKVTLLARGLINPEDLSLYRICQTPEEAVEHVCAFYRVFHSSRYVRDRYVMRLKHRISDADVADINKQFAVLVKQGRIEQTAALEEERGQHPDLPRLSFEHTRRNFGLVRQLIDRVNECDPA